MNVKVPWNPRKFLREQYRHLPDNPVLRPVITLSGSSENTYANTCEGYIQRTWPCFGSKILALFQGAIDSAEDVFQSDEDDFAAWMSFGSTSTKLHVAGCPLFLVEIAEIVIWLASACRASAFDDRMQVCRLDLSRVVDESADFGLVANFLYDDVVSGNTSSGGSCWHLMFRNPIIAGGYPVSARNTEERGFEAPLELILSLARTSWATVHNGALVLEGFATVLTPTLKIWQNHGPAS